MEGRARMWVLSLSVVYSQSAPSPLFTIKLYSRKLTCIEEATRDYTVVLLDDDWLSEFINIGSSLETCPDFLVYIILE